MNAAASVSERPMLNTTGFARVLIYHATGMRTSSTAHIPCTMTKRVLSIPLKYPTKQYASERTKLSMELERARRAMWDGMLTAAALGELFEMGLGQIGYAAEVAMEHHLVLTCDPIGGLVQIPCIERNAVAAMRAINALSLANFLSETSKISFDTVVHTMYETGRDLNRVYRETAEGGLAKNYHPEK